jgi:hypothetical protein
MVNPTPALAVASRLHAPVITLDSSCGHLSLSCVSVEPAIAQFLLSPSSIHTQSSRDERCLEVSWCCLMLPAFFLVRFAVQSLLATRDDENANLLIGAFPFQSRLHPHLSSPPHPPHHHPH